MSNSRWALTSDLTDAIAGGADFEEWLADRIPVASYARISRSHDGAVERQHLNNRAAAARLGWAVVCLYTDDGISAADSYVRRAAFERMVGDLLRRRTADGFPISGVISVEEERLARRAGDYICLLRALSVGRDGYLFLVDSGELIDIPEVLKALDAGLVPRGQVESERVGRRRRRSIRDRAGEGRGSGGQRRFGWLGPDGDEQRATNTVLDPFESKYLREAVDRALAGATWMSIADWLTTERVPTVRGGRWTIPTVQAMLTNPAICGYRLLDGVLVRDRETGEPLVGEWQTLVSAEEWSTLVDRCNRWYSPNGDRKGHKDRSASRVRSDGQRFGRRGRTAESTSPRKYLLSGFLRCGYSETADSPCGFKMGGHPPHGTNRQGSYRCSSSGCRKVGRRVDLLDRYIEAIVCEELEFTPQRWESLAMEEKRDAVALLIEAVVVRPIPKGRPRNAPFDSGLIEVIKKSMPL